MFDENTLEKILNDSEVRKVPYNYKYIVISAIEKILDEQERSHERNNEPLLSAYEK